VSIVLILFLLPAVLYAAAWRLSLHGRRRMLTATLLALALALHAASLILPWQAGSFYYGFAKLLSATVWIGVLLVWVESARVDLASVASLLAPLAIVLVVLPYFFPGVAFDLDAQPPLFVPHLVVGTLAYGVMFLAAMQALLMAAAEQRLHPRRPSERPGLLASLVARRGAPLPPLMALERILFRVIAIGFVLLLLTTVTGIVFSEEIFGKPLQLNHKTVFSLVATVFVGVLLAGHWLWGWRGRTAIRLTLGGFMLLLLSYVGSRFVLEVVLRRI
jgi:ABC-type uncharacterized transport system permease subunit